MSNNEARQKPITMEELAKMAGVHSRTVADALKGTGRVAPATREKVLTIARELSYVPNAAARALATGRTGGVAVVSGPLNEFFYANLVHLLENHLTSSGYDMTLLHTGRSPEDLIQATQSALVDGVIVIGGAHTSEEFLRLLSNSRQPCVLIYTSHPDFIDHITLDLYPAVEEALQLMVTAGRQRIAYVINNRDDAASGEVRMRTYLNFTKKRDYVPELIDVDTKMLPEKRIQAVKCYINAHGCPEALLCQNDETAIYTYRAVVELGLRIPDDVLLVGCDGLPYMEFFAPPLSTIALPAEKICVTATQFLQNRMESPYIPIQHAMHQGRLMVRESLGIDPYVGIAGTMHL